MKNKISGVIILAGLLASGASHAGLFDAIMKPPETTTVLNTDPVTVVVPNDPDIRHGSLTNPLRDLVEPDNALIKTVPRAEYYGIRKQDFTDGSFIVHIRTSNGVAGSGLKYTVKYNVADTKDGYKLTYQPVSVASYQQGLIGKYPVPTFPVDNLRQYLEKSYILYQFDVNSQYNSDSVYANFRRMARTAYYARGHRDPITGKIYQNWFVDYVRGTPIKYTMEAFPYHNGSKAVIYASIPAIETSPGVVDYGLTINNFKHDIERIVNN